VYKKITMSNICIRHNILVFPHSIFDLFTGKTMMLCILILYRRRI